MPRSADSREVIIDLLGDGQARTAPQIAEAAGVTRNYVDKVLAKEADRVEVIGKSANGARIIRLRPDGQPPAGTGRPRAKAWPFKVGVNVRVVGERYDARRKCVVVSLKAGELTYELEVK